MKDIKTKLQSDGGSWGMWFITRHNAHHILHNVRTSSSTFGVFCCFSCSWESARTFCHSFSTFSDSMCWCKKAENKKLRAAIFIRKLEYWSKNVYFLICRFCLRILLCAAVQVRPVNFEFGLMWILNCFCILIAIFYLLPDLSSPFSLFHCFFWFVPQKCRIQIGIDRLYRCCTTFGGWLSSWTSCSLYCEFATIRFSLFDSLESRFLCLRFSFNYFFFLFRESFAICESFEGKMHRKTVFIYEVALMNT